MGEYSKGNVDVNIYRTIMSTNTIKLLSLLSENLMEYGDLKNIEPYSFVQKDSSNYTFDSEEGSNVDVIFTKITELEVKHTKIPKIIDKKKISSYFNLGYKVQGVESQAKKSDFKELLRIMKTITIVVDDFLGKNNGAALLVFEQNKNPKLRNYKGQKSLLYNAVITQNLPSGYTSREVSFMDAQGLIIAPE